MDYLYGRKIIGRETGYWMESSGFSDAAYNASLVFIIMLRSIKISGSYSEAAQGTGKSASGTTSINQGNLKDLPDNVQKMYKEYDASGWKGNVKGQTAGTKAGGNYDNYDMKLPTIDSTGNPINYREFDINNKLIDVARDTQRFVVGSDGSVYYTDSHYGTGVSIAGLPDFTKIN